MRDGTFAQVCLAKTLHIRRINDLEAHPRRLFEVKIFGMIWLVRHSLGWLIGAFRSREELLLENLAVRQQLLALDCGSPQLCTFAESTIWLLSKAMN